MTEPARPSPVSNKAFLQALHRAGVIPDPSTVIRVVIDVGPDTKCPLVYVQTYATAGLIGVVGLLPGLVADLPPGLSNQAATRI